MRSQPAVETNITGVVTILSISPLEEDHIPLRRIILHTTWMLLQARDVVSALPLLQQPEIGVVLCERDLQPGTWIDLLEQINSLPNAPSLIVASRLADERLWAEALNLGAWDVLAKPFDQAEVLRSVRSGWQHWHDRALAVKVLATAS